MYDMTETMAALVQEHLRRVSEINKLVTDTFESPSVLVVIWNRVSDTR